VEWQLRDRILTTARGTLVMGIVNVTPDSFSDGGSYATAPAAVAHGLRLAYSGADIVDVGGESTRPGAAAVAAGEELRRVVPVIRALSTAGVAVSVDTSKAEVAAAALAAGAEAVNDVTALGDPEMAGVVAESGAGIVLMHMQGEPRTMQDDPRYVDVVAEVAAYLEERAGLARAAGIPPQRICIDPGIGFGKTADHNLALLAGLARLVRLGYPVLVGTSRKAFLGTILEGAPPAHRDEATAVTAALAAREGAAMVRVHDAARTAQALRVADAIVRHGTASPAGGAAEPRPRAEEAHSTW
jgi:dihydropteroate synthase